MSKIVVAMSGGVDSSVAALILKEQGHDLLGVSMQVWDYRRNGGCSTRATCCSPDDFTDARQVAGRIGIPYYVFDFEKRFESEVINRFINEYQTGLTPTPCVECNNKVKFRALRERAEQIGCEALATGHYAQVELRDGKYRLLRSVDSAKDQSYFLYGLTQKDLAHTLFPIGAMTKPEVRELARLSGLKTADKSESQDICFVSGTVAEFMQRRGIKTRQGDIVTSAGEKVGTHEGVHHFTVGQRRGIGVGGKTNPLYVLNLDADSNKVIVGERDELDAESFEVGEISWTTESPLAQQSEIECLAQLRHRHSPLPVKVTQSVSGVTARFISETSYVSPGQAAVFYDLSNREVLGGGKIGRGTRGLVAS